MQYRVSVYVMYRSLLWMRFGLVQILKFDGGETSEVTFLEKDDQGRHLSSLIIHKVSQVTSASSFTYIQYIYYMKLKYITLLS